MLYQKFSVFAVQSTGFPTSNIHLPELRTVYGQTLYDGFIHRTQAAYKGLHMANRKTHTRRVHAFFCLKQRHSWKKKSGLAGVAFSSLPIAEKLCGSNSPEKWGVTLTLIGKKPKKKSQLIVFGRLLLTAEVECAVTWDDACWLKTTLCAKAALQVIPALVAGELQAHISL